MKTKLHNTITKLLGLSRSVVPSALMIAMLHFPLFPNSTLPMLLKPVSAPATASVSVENNLDITNVFFGNDIPREMADEIVNKQMSFVSSRGAYSASLAVIQKHAGTIKEIAQAKGVPQDVAIGVSLLENGGSETAESPAGALGVFQLMPGTARNLGLTVDKNTDDRKDPYLNIAAGITYLKGNYDRFGDWGLATWAYHAGEGNVAKALKIYAKANGGVNLVGVKDADEMRAYVAAHSITVNKLLSDPSVKAFTDKLHDDTAGYPFKVLATATLFRQANS